MATTERDNTTSSDERRKSYITDKPLFTSRHQPREDIWTARRNDIARKKAIAKEDEGRERERERAMGTVGTAPEPQPRGWLSSAKTSGSGIGLGEAFQRTDDNGSFVPRTRPGLADREGTVSGSRIPRTRTFSPEAARASPSPPRADRDAYILKGREGRTASEPAINYESEDTGAIRQTSPSPGPRVRRWTERGSGSDASNTGLVENPTNDKPVWKMTQDEKDDAYIKRRLNGPPIYKRPGGMGSRIAETTRTLATKTSASSLVEEPDPPYNIPKSWGAKATKQRKWMDKILYGSSPDNSLELKDPLEHPASSERPRTASDIPMPSIEDRSSIQEPTPPASRPASAQPTNASPEKSKMWDADLDFTAQSLQISTSPQLRVKSSRIDELRSREIQNLSARAVATNRLEEIRERNSEERSFSTEYAAPIGEPAQEERSLVSEPARIKTEYAAPVGEPALKDVVLDSARINTKDAARKAEPVQEEYEFHEKTILEEEGEKIPFAPITVFRAKDFDDYVKRNNIVFSGSSSSSSDSFRPGSRHRRDNSHELLKRLSRSLSSSPAPPRPEEPVSDSKADKPMIQDRIEKPIVQQESTIQNPIVQPDSTTQNGMGQDDPEERIAAEARLFELQDKSERGSIRAPSPSEETPRPKADPLSFPTPKVTGAYIETPMPIRAKSPRPPLINTANRFSAAEDARRIQLEAQLEDTTMLEDFDAMLEAEVPAPEGHTTIIEPVLDLEYSEHGLPLSKKEIERRIERLTLDRMNQSLKATSTSIRDARHGIERLEEQVSSSFVKVAQRSNDDGIAYINIRIPVPRLYIRQPVEKLGMKSGWKFTWLGFILSLFMIWYVSESAMCAQFCHPTNSRVNTWQPSDPFFPWAIPTKLDQWMGGVVSSNLGSVASALGIGGDWGLFPNVPPGYKGGPINSNDWWLGRSGPVGVVAEDRGGTFNEDEMI